MIGYGLRSREVHRLRRTKETFLAITLQQTTSHSHPKSESTSIVSTLHYHSKTLARVDKLK
jgi:hypothetical protein